MRKLAVVLSIVLLVFLASGVYAEEYGVYVKVAEKVSGTFPDIVKSVEGALKNKGWEVLASYEASSPEGCGFKAHTIVIHSQPYAQKILSQGPASSFALPLRVSIFSDEKGTNVAFLNPASLNRTILGDTAEKDFSVAKMKELSGLLASAAKGTVVNQQIGEKRSQGYVGGMGGGAFNEKIDVIFKQEDKGAAFQEIAAKVKAGIVANTKGWRLVYTLDEGNSIIYGIDSPKTEARAYAIAGEKRASKSNACPGIDHAAAFPIEVVVMKEHGMVKVVTMEEMYRMKLYFEDAGKWAFMKNMRMPGQIEKEITEISSSKLR